MLKELPEGIGNLCNLRYMDISWCPQITTLPASITRLYNLQTLNLRACHMLEELPDGIGNLCNLRYMDISSYIKITTLPTSITRLSSLQTLNLFDCRMLIELPEGIGNLCNLRYMDISRCPKITTLPTSITRLSSLQTLNLSSCWMLEELPEGIGNLCNLRYMDISECSKITMLPTSIIRLSSLQTLNLFNCRMLEELPEGIGNLCNLRYMDISWCERVTMLPTSITRLSSLQTLNLSYCRMLKELPEGIANLCNLRHLDITECYHLACIPRGLGRLSNLETLTMFIVAQENGHTIAELQHLNSIRGSLKIKNLHHVKDPDEAMQANLRAKTRLNRLSLEWNEGGDEEHEPSSTEVEVAEGVFERLQPHHNLEKLEIYSYIGTRFPNWMSPSFPNLVELTMGNLKRCEHLPLGPWPSLKSLRLYSMHAVRRIGEEFYGDGGGITFPSLEDLTLEDMPNLEKWHAESCPRLTKLEISSCPKLVVIPCSMETLTIRSSNEMLLSAGSLAKLSKLRSLQIFRCGISSSSSSGWWDGLQCLTALEKLRIVQCDELTCLPEDIMYLPSLQTLQLVRNRNLRSLERGGRKQQQPTPFFTTLQYLYIQESGMLTSLPEWVGGLTSLQELNISDLPQLAMLPEGLRHLTALRQLNISNLPQLKMLPDGLQLLTALQYLWIGGCPQLVRRCKRETGEDWHKIAHIPHISIWPSIREEEDRREEENSEEMNERRTFAAKFLDRFGFARCTGHS
uniref:Disease resistance protein RGA3 isoform X1 n=2 Tax=Elaeis guineensis var. tenera TaxID=51953 RepID=A0A6J0PDQ4_ELAGV|nr:putative disease resistance protein RGA3 isoform X1 [Elaeis guineensis]XP_029118037.1 putative disease resistance protein RGA3 isoform X1 [Elaeis guineensis]XP_029118038.1 putative disease resistance protein RGA3 isoform X1 [Elaeis guineensis]XP_029118039.1 putative disease resistance protein RGA3 isoform X1 [Elaeis guineensis]XP_029118040.1 putative disease resistance protein RGA3 isoform X1 [Elaeis guineensis]